MTPLQTLLKLAPVVADNLYNPSIAFFTVGEKKFPIRSFAGGTVRAVDLGDYRFMTQNPSKDTVWAEAVRKGDKIVWVVHQPSNHWTLRVVNGIATLL